MAGPAHGYQRIILVGGFGDSPYLLQAVKRTFGQNKKITITVPSNPWVYCCLSVVRIADNLFRQAAIVQGAALRGLQGVRSTVKRCRRHYGLPLDTVYRPGIDDEKQVYIRHFSNTKYVRGTMTWAVRKVCSTKVLTFKKDSKIFDVP